MWDRNLAAPLKPLATRRGYEHIVLTMKVLKQRLPMYAYAMGLGFLLLIPGFANAELLDKVVAVVNEDVITQIELDRELKQIKRQLMQQRGTLPPRETLNKQILERMILIRIQLQRAARRHIRVDDNALNRALNNIAKQNKMELYNA